MKNVVTYLINGTVRVDGVLFVRIDKIEDDESANRVGVDFLRHPYALMLDHEAAVRVVEFLNRPSGAGTR